MESKLLRLSRSKFSNDLLEEAKDYDLNSLISFAAINDNLDLVDNLYRLGFGNINSIFSSALNSCSTSVIKYSLINGAYVGDEIYGAVKLNDIKSIITLFEIIDIEDIINDEWLINAVNESVYINTDITKYLISKGAPYNGVINTAARLGDIDLVVYLIDNKYISMGELNSSLESAAFGNNFHIVNYLLTKGAKNIKSAIQKAKLNNNHVMVEHLMKFKK